MDMLDKYEELKQSPDYKNIIHILEQLSALPALDSTNASNLGFELGQYYHLFSNRPDVVHSISPKDIKITQSMLSKLLKTITNFQSGFSKGFESATDKEIMRRYHVKEG